MFNFKNKIISWYYKYTDNLIMGKYTVSNHMLTVGRKYAINYNFFITIPGLVLILFGILFKNVFNNHSMRYFFIVVLVYFVLMLLILFVQFVNESVRKREFRSLLFFLGSWGILMLYHIFLRSSVNRFIDKRFSHCSFIAYWSVSLLIILIIVIIGIKFNNKNKY